MSMNNPIGKLQELHQRNLESSPGPPLYNLVEASGEAHGPTFKMEAMFRGITAIGEGSSKKQAKTLAAAKLLSKLDEAVNPDLMTPVSDPSSTGNRVGELQEFCSCRWLIPPWYEEVAAVGPDHSRNFIILCRMGDLSEKGEGTTKKSAKREAAHKVLERLKSMSEDQLKALENPDAKKRNLDDEGDQEVDEGVGDDGEPVQGEGAFIGVWTGNEPNEVNGRRDSSSLDNS